jgi:hypothetical protein
MFAHRTATGLTLALLALPATATAQPFVDTSGGGGGGGPATQQELSHYYGWGQTSSGARALAPTSSLAGTTSMQDLRSPDAADAARAGDIAKAMEHYQRSQPTTVAATPASHDNDAPAWPEIAFAGVVLLATAGGVVRVRMRRHQRVAA